MPALRELENLDARRKELLVESDVLRRRLQRNCETLVPVVSRVGLGIEWLGRIQSIWSVALPLIGLVSARRKDSDSRWSRKLATIGAVAGLLVPLWKWYRRASSRPTVSDPSGEST